MLRKSLILSLAGSLLLSFYMTSCANKSVDNTLKEREERSLKLQETLKIIRAETDPNFVKRLNQVNELLDEISADPYRFGVWFGNFGSVVLGLKPFERTFLKKTQPLIENPDIALPLMFERLEHKKLDKNYYRLVGIYFLIFGKTKSAESIPYIADFITSAASEKGEQYPFTAQWAAQEITSLEVAGEGDSSNRHLVDIAKKLRKWYDAHKKISE